MTEPLSEHSDLWDMIDQRIQMHVRQSAADMATVQGGDGGRYRVQMDSEDQPRQVGFLHAAGQRFSPGDRVPILYSRSGEPMILPSMTEAQGGGEAVVGGEHVLPQSIDRGHVRPNAIGGSELAQASVDRGHVKPNAIGGTELDSTSVTSRHIQGRLGKDTQPSDSVYSADLNPLATTNALNGVDGRATGARNRADDAYNRASTGITDAGKAQSTADAAKKDAGDAKTQGDRNANDIKALQTQLSRIAKRQA